MQNSPIDKKYARALPLFTLSEDNVLTLEQPYQGQAFLKSGKTTGVIIQLKRRNAVDKQAILLKRFFDLFFASSVMILGFPIFMVLYFITKFSSKGPAFYKQERIGKNGKPFYIYKFRSMVVDAEAAGPRLSSAGDPRITSWGRIIRRTRLDEMPQFWNVFKGDMSVVGPRPERTHFIEKIKERNPDYSRLHSIKPGVTSRGQVFYGYAENVEQMCIRMGYDLDYLENISLKSDLVIILRTIKVMFQAKGK